MKKLVIFDPNGKKFTADMIDWWSRNGYETIFDRYYDPKKVDWADVIWFDTCDNSIKMAHNPPDEPDFEGWDMHQMDLSNKKIIVRPIDIEVWYGHQHNVDWNLVSDTVFIAPHIQEVANNFEGLRDSTTRQHVIPCAVNLDRWTFKERKPGYDIAWVCERWASKGIDYALQIMAKLPKEYKLHALGIWHDYAWETAYHKDLIKRLGMEDRIVFYENSVDSVDEWLEDKNYILSTSKKEAFGYSIAEGMAKGLKPIVHHYFGAEHIWPGITWNTIDEAVRMIQDTDDYQSSMYLEYLKTRGYTTPQMMQKIEEVIS